MICPYSFGQGSGNAIRCGILRDRGEKWDFCVHQYYCRAEGKQKLSDGAGQCRIRRKDVI